MRSFGNPLHRPAAKTTYGVGRSFHSVSTISPKRFAKRLSTARRLQLLGVLLLFGYQQAHANIVTIGFETFADGTPIIDGTAITTQFPGLTFANTTVISAGISLNEFEFPPHSGSNVAFDDGGPISINFSTPITTFTGYFTYDEPLTLAAFNASANQVAVATSLFSSNDALFGDPGSRPNEFLQVSFENGISGVTITGDPRGGSFVMDDLTITSGTPEPSFRILLLISLAGMVTLHKRFS